MFTNSPTKLSSSIKYGLYALGFYFLGGTLTFVIDLDEWIDPLIYSAMLNSPVFYYGKRLLALSLHYHVVLMA